jgi:hypothetical protein
MFTILLLFTLPLSGLSGLFPQCYLVSMPSLLGKTRRYLHPSAFVAVIRFAVDHGFRSIAWDNAQARDLESGLRILAARSTIFLLPYEISMQSSGASPMSSSSPLQ